MSVKPFFPAHFKSPEGSKKRFKELRHKFRYSEIARRLIDYAAQNDVELVEDSEYLDQNGYGGVYFNRKRSVVYSRHNPAGIILHEFRHAVQFDRLNLVDPEIVTDRYGADIRKAILSVAFMEADACYHQDRMHLEMAGDYVSMRNPKVYFTYFCNQRSRMGKWFKDASEKNLRLAVSFAKEASGAWEEEEGFRSGFWLRLYDNLLLKRFLKEENKKEKNEAVMPDDDTISYMRRLSSGICVDDEGQDYLSHGLTKGQVDLLFSLLWVKIFTPDVRARVRLFDHHKSLYSHKSSWDIRSLLQGRPRLDAL